MGQPWEKRLAHNGGAVPFQSLLGKSPPPSIHLSMHPPPPHLLPSVSVAPSPCQTPYQLEAVEDCGRGVLTSRGFQAPWGDQVFPQREGFTPVSLQADMTVTVATGGWDPR